MGQTVTDAQGQVHEFPDEATPEMIAKALNVQVAPPPKDGLGWRVLGGVEDAFGTRDFQMSDFATGPKQLLTHPIDTLGMVGEAADAGQRAEYEKMYKTDNPLMKAGRYVYGTVPVIGPALGNAADKFESGDYAGGTAQTLGIAAQTLGGSPEARTNAAKVVTAPTKSLADFAGAPSDPHILYRKFLAPIADQPAMVPKAPPRVMSAVLRDMENAGDGALAARIRAGQATVSDLDALRMRANRVASTIYKSPGNYHTGMAEGADQLADSIRDQIYPKIEQANGLEPGTLSKVKNLQGQAMAAERRPSLPNRLVTKTVGTLGGGAIGFEVGGYPGAVLGSVAGERLAEPLGSAVDRGIIGLKTRRLSTSLPPAKTPYPR